jgi:hypothetical protein
MSYKSSVKKAINNYFERTSKPSEREKRPKNKTPEKDLRQLVMKHLKQQGVLVLYVESQAVFSESAARYLHGQVSVGTSDLIGCLPSGRFLAIELKAPGRIRTLKPHQREFLVKVIQMGGIGLVADKIDLIDWILDQCSQIASDKERVEFLLSQLPTPKQEADLIFD